MLLKGISMGQYYAWDSCYIKPQFSVRIVLGNVVNQSRLCDWMFYALGELMTWGKNLHTTAYGGDPIQLCQKRCSNDTWK